MVAFTKAEKEFLSRHEVCRVATCHDDLPHVVPVSYVLDEGEICFATDYETRKFKNLKANANVAIAIDEFSKSRNAAVCIQGTAELLETGDEFRRLYKIFHSKFDWVRGDPWGEGEAPFVKVKPTSKVSWGLRG